MKELSIEEKAKLYDEAIERAKSLLSGNQLGNAWIYKLLPELKVSEDEMIRKAIIMFFELQDDNTTYSLIPKKDILAWLEKQGKKIDAIENFDTEFEKQISYLIASVINKDYEYTKDFVKWASEGLLNYAKHKIEKNNMGISEATKQKLEDNLNKALEKETPESFNEFLDEQGEQKSAEEYNITGIGFKNAQGKLGEMIKNIKPVNEVLEQKPTDKIEPKFEIGDLITNGVLVGKIDEIHEHGYHAYFGDHYADVPDVENWHKWTIQDAKDGDVLVTNSNIIFIFKYLDEGGTIAFRASCTENSGVYFPKIKERLCDQDAHPATKEQRDLLFQKMKEEGYEWDTEKKELKKVDQKPSWSEEDEDILNTIINHFKIDIECTDEDDIVRWLKNLKDRYTWKPSDEQMSVIEAVINNRSFQRIHLDSLYTDLKKLRGE